MTASSQGTRQVCCIVMCAVMLAGAAHAQEQRLQTAPDQGLLAWRERLVREFHVEGHAFLKEQYRPELAEVAQRLATPQQVQAMLKRERESLAQTEKLLEGTRVVEGHINALTGLLDFMMGAMGMMSAPDRSPSVDLVQADLLTEAVETTLAGFRTRVRILERIAKVDARIANGPGSRARFPGNPTPRRSRSPYAF